ncbi:MAG: hypothetical protein ACYC1D_11520 [Acidimicrobiales bacterium]
MNATWVMRYTSTLETRIRYLPSDAFLTLPRPEPTPALAELGERLDRDRRALMLGRAWGLTTTYNHVHDPTDWDPAVAALREIHEAIDRARLRRLRLGGPRPGGRPSPHQDRDPLDRQPRGAFRDPRPAPRREPPPPRHRVRLSRSGGATWLLRPAAPQGSGGERYRRRDGQPGVGALGHSCARTFLRPRPPWPDRCVQMAIGSPVRAGTACNTSRVPRPVYRILEVRCSPRVEQKINQKHSVTFQEVTEAVVYCAVERSAVQHQPDGDLRMLVVGTTASGRRIFVVLYQDRRESSAFWLGTAIPE